jgi:hypothetical protein
MSIGCFTANMSKSLARQGFGLLATLAFLTVSTVALAHSHQDVNSADESHCVMCMAVHGATHLIAAPGVALHFAPVQVPLLVFAERINLPFVEQFAIQGRAPPQV